jgi:transcriptional regulator with XRE-family HTH domain
LLETEADRMADDLHLQLGERIRVRRIHAGLTQARLARSAQVSRRHLAALEKGANVSLATLVRVSQALELPLSDTFGGVVPFRVQTAVPRYASAFISYGAPDEDVARRLFNELTLAGVTCFFFPECARPGARIHRAVADAIESYDRFLLLCSAPSLARPGVANEIQQILAREAADGGAELVIPIALDDSFYRGALPCDEAVVRELRGRVAADFRVAIRDESVWHKQVERIVRVLRKQNSAEH